MTTIAVTGPESTGKTAISEYLAGTLPGTVIPEFAREYISRINRPYNYNDIEFIAETQVKQRKEAEAGRPGYLILDTWLIITKVWFLEVYGEYPPWLDRSIQDYPVDLFIVCLPDIPWVPDQVRENGGERRNYLLQLYIEEISKTGMPFEFVSGSGQTRLVNSLNIVRKHFTR